MNNIPELTVSELVNNLRIVLEDAFPLIKVRGEISEISKPSSGHLYLQLKDCNAVLKCVCWKNNKVNLTKDMEINAEVVCTGTISLYPQSSCYQLVLYKMDYASQGAIMAAIEKRRQRLEKEGLFDPKKKKSIPSIPSSIGIITSPHGAVIQDMLHRIRNRFPCKVVIFPALMQGVNASSQVIAGIKYFMHNPTDVLIIARGGGSVEELMPFNSEELVREIVNCNIPIISAIGHETNFTLIDYAADLRAPTPTAAAELATPNAIDLKIRLFSSVANIKNHCNNQLKAASYNLNNANSTALSEISRLLYKQTTRLSALTNELEIKSRKTKQNAICKLYDCKLKNTLCKNSLMLKLQTMQSTFERQNFLQKIIALKLEVFFMHNKLIATKQNKLTTHASILRLVLQNKLTILQHLALTHSNKIGHRLDLILTTLQASNPNKNMNKSLIRVYNENNQLITSALLAQQSKKIRLEFANGGVAVSVLPYTEGIFSPLQD